MKASYHVFIGDFEGAESETAIATSIARRTGADYLADWASYVQGKVLALSGEPAVARDHLERVRASLAKSPRIVAGTHVYLGLAALRAGDFAWAEIEARAGLAAHSAPATRAVALAVLARALVGLSRSKEAREAAEGAMETLRTAGGIEENESVIHLALAEALHADGADAEARRVVEVACQRLSRIASHLGSAARRERFLEGIESHARTSRLAEALGAPQIRY
jgi:eukaryotic-like serine/threonine-protein kinase